MNILIVYSHPANTSYTYQILTQLQARLLQQTWSVEISDLYALDFQSDMTAREYEREALGNTSLPLAPDVLAEHAKIQRADCILFLYPVWWSDCPAKLKGWFDRVLTVGFAYKQSDQAAGMQTVKYGVAICTAGYTNEALRDMGIAQSMETVMLDDRFGKRFDRKEMIILGGTLDRTSAQQQHADQITQLMNNLEAIA